MNVNLDKTKTIIFSTRKVNFNIALNFESDNIDIVDSYVYLGVDLYYNGKLKYAIDSFANHVTRAVFSLRNAYRY